MGGCQNYGPFLGPCYNKGPNTGPNLGDPKRDHIFDNSPCRALASGFVGVSCVWGYGFKTASFWASSLQLLV